MNYAEPNQQFKRQKPIYQEPNFQIICLDIALACNLQPPGLYRKPDV